MVVLLLFHSCYERACAILHLYIIVLLSFHFVWNTQNFENAFLFLLLSSPIYIFQWRIQRGFRGFTWSGVSLEPPPPFFNILWKWKNYYTPPPNFVCGGYTVFTIIIPPANFVCGGYTVFTLSVRPCVRVSVRNILFFNILKSRRWIFIKPCKHVHICKTNTLDKKVGARGQFN